MVGETRNVERATNSERIANDKGKLKTLRDL